MHRWRRDDTEPIIEIVDIDPPLDRRVTTLEEHSKMVVTFKHVAFLVVGLVSGTSAWLLSRLIYDVIAGPRPYG